MYEQKIIALVGGMCSGKDTWADFLVSEFGYTKISTSDIVRSYIEQNSLGEPTRDNTRIAATKIRESKGEDYLVEASLLSSPVTNLVFSGLYTVAEARCVKRHKGIIVGISTDDGVRFERMAARGRSGEYPSKDEYMRLVNNDLKAADTDQALGEVLQMADCYIDGDIPITEINLCRSMAIRIMRIFDWRKDAYV